MVERLNGKMNYINDTCGKWKRSAFRGMDLLKVNFFLFFPSVCFPFSSFHNKLFSHFSFIEGGTFLCGPVALRRPEQ